MQVSMQIWQGATSSYTLDEEYNSTWYSIEYCIAGLYIHTLIQSESI